MEKKKDIRKNFFTTNTFQIFGKKRQWGLISSDLSWERFARLRLCNLEVLISANIITLVIIWFIPLTGYRKMDAQLGWYSYTRKCHSVPGPCKCGFLSMNKSFTTSARPNGKWIKLFVWTNNWRLDGFNDTNCRGSVNTFVYNQVQSFFRLLHSVIFFLETWVMKLLLRYSARNSFKMSDFCNRNKQLNSDVWNKEITTLNIFYKQLLNIKHRKKDR